MVKGPKLWTDKYKLGEISAFDISSIFCFCLALF